MKLKIFVFLLCVELGMCAAQSIKWITPMDQVFANNGSAPKPSGNSSLITGQIIAGSTAALGQFPWQAALSITKSAGTYICGGSLIHAEWVLSAGHCTIGASSIQVRLGTLNRNSAQYIPSSLIITHSGYSSSTLANDVGLIKLKVPANLTPGSNIKVIKIVPTSPTTTTFSKLTVSGWGRTCDSCNAATVLNYAVVNYITYSQCSQYYSITSNTICTMGSPKQSTCKGDSGGPLIVDGPTPYLVGVVSFVSSAGCSAGHPAGYVRIASFCTSWLKSNIPEFGC